MRDRERRELGPNEVWLGDSGWSLNLTDYTIVHDDEKIGTGSSVPPTVLLMSDLVERGERTPDGDEVHGPTATWFELSRQLQVDPGFRFEFTSSPTKFEEFLAGAYKLHGWEAVTLTPRSGDRGRDVIAITSQMSAMRVLDQAKAYGPGNLVTQDDVRAIFGVVCLDHRATKGIITTTSDFAVGVADEFQHVIPYQLETKNGEQFLEWIRRVPPTHRDRLQRPETKRIEPPAGIIQPWIVPASRRRKPHGEGG